MNASLKDLGNDTIFVKGVFGSVHESCSPWTPVEIDTAYIDAVNRGFTKYQDLLGASTPREHQYMPPSIVDCNICLQYFKPTDKVMLIPVAADQFKKTKDQKKLAGLATCNCTSLVNGHNRLCDYA